MASTAIQSEEEKKEFFDTEEELEQKVTQLAELIKESRHFIVFTGAGISTSTGIPDFRSGYNTVLPTGPGAWEVLAKEKKGPKIDHKAKALQAIPSKTHMSFVKLHQEGLLKYVVSQNTDGLHRKSGIHPNSISELHGNTNLERCIKCGREFMRDFKTRVSQNAHKHETGRLCDDATCKGVLLDSIINFGESLNQEVLENAYNQARKSDLCLAMGSSLRVQPAAEIPYQVTQRNGKLVIVNLQKTPLDSLAEIRIFAMCDKVIQMLMNKLNYEIPKFKLQRRLKVQKVQKESGDQRITFTGVDIDLKVFTLFPKIKVKLNPQNVQTELNKEPFQIDVESISTSCELTLFFQGHYGEPQLSLSIDFDCFTNYRVYLFEFNIEDHIWDKVVVESEG